jgi:hypothetical protein
MGKEPIAQRELAEGGVTIMDLHEQLALQMAKERIADAVREAQRMRAIGFTGARRSARVRLGSALVRLGRWMAGQSRPVPS